MSIALPTDGTHLSQCNQDNALACQIVISKSLTSFIKTDKPQNAHGTSAPQNKPLCMPYMPALLHKMRHFMMRNAPYCTAKSLVLHPKRAPFTVRTCVFRHKKCHFFVHTLCIPRITTCHTHHYGCTHFLAFFAAVLLLFSNIARIGGVRKIRKKGNWHKRLKYENAILRQAYACRIAAIGTAICKKIKKYRKHPITKVHAHTFLIYKKHILSKT